MEFIAHRGLMDGPNKQFENSPEQIINALNEGFTVEMDMWSVDNSVWLGHNEPVYFINNRDFLEEIIEKRSNVLIHAKNEEVLNQLNNLDINIFWHDSDKYTISSWSWLIGNLNVPVLDAMLVNQPEMHPFFDDISHLNVLLCEQYIRKYAMNAGGFMTKYPRLFKEAWGRIKNDQ